jgi:hypothetical protein
MKPNFRVRGVAAIERTAAKTWLQKFEWSRMPETKKPPARLSVFVSTNWYFSDAFNRAFKPQQIPGELFLDPEQALIYFDIEIE